MTDHDALLAAVAAAPADDAPRLVLADWYDENGQPARATMIRKMVEKPTAFISVYPNMTRHKSGWRSQGRGIQFPKLGGLSRALAQSFGHPHRGISIRRGFVETLVVSAEDWLANAEADLARHPITRVQLTTLPEMKFDFGGGGDIPKRTYLPGRPKSGLDLPAGYPFGNWYISESLKREWPGVTIALPLRNYLADMMAREISISPFAVRDSREHEGGFLVSPEFVPTIQRLMAMDSGPVTLDARHLVTNIAIPDELVNDSPAL